MTEPATTATVIYSDEQIEIRCLAVSEMDNRCYLLTGLESGRQLLIDAADDPQALLGMVSQHGDGSLDAVLTTHAHWDHTRALADVVAATDAITVAGADDAAAITEQRGVHIERRVHHDDILCDSAGGPLTLACVGLRGHTPGSIAYVLQASDATLIFSGDSLFPGGVGNTDHDQGRFTQLLDDVTRRLFDVYPDDAIVLPGHGQSTTLGAERPHLDEWRNRGW